MFVDNIFSYANAKLNKSPEPQKISEKNNDLHSVLTSIFYHNTPELTQKILKSTINNIIGKSEDNKQLCLDSEITNAINSLTTNSSKYFSKKITRGAVQVIFATCYSLLKQNPLKRIISIDINSFTNLSNRDDREAKINLVNIVLNDLIKQGNFPNLPREHNMLYGKIQFSDPSYFDIISVDKSGVLKILGNGYNYSSNEQYFFGSKIKK